MLVHLSDCHLDGSPGRTERLSDVIATIPSWLQPDAVVLTGDLADHGAPEEYEELSSVLDSALSVPWLAVPGNHDDPQALAKGLDVDVPVAVLDVADVRVIGLDVTVPGKSHGFLRQEVAEAAVDSAVGAAQIVLAFHQQPIWIGHPLAQEIALHNADDLGALIERLGRVAAVLVGHVHTPFAATLAGTPVLGAPGIATALEYDAVETLSLTDAVPPGLALHRIDGAGVSSVLATAVPRNARST